MTMGYIRVQILHSDLKLNCRRFSLYSGYSQQRINSIYPYINNPIISDDKKFANKKICEKLNHLTLFFVRVYISMRIYFCLVIDSKNKD